MMIGILLFIMMIMNTKLNKCVHNMNTKLNECVHIQKIVYIILYNITNSI